MDPYAIHSEVWPLDAIAYQTPFEGIPMRYPLHTPAHVDGGMAGIPMTMGRTADERKERAARRSGQIGRTSQDVTRVSGAAADVASDVGNILGVFGVGPRRAPPVQGGDVVPIQPRPAIPAWVPYAAGAVLLLGVVYFATRS